ncbi:uncharacterized protein LOC105885744 [Microcebus murinus]|uniref:uncharacterized protein LOC105885744 n=1 Tax=Microcebus murinus TaxID=30608 RepID=UPI003F6C41F9
MLRRGACRPPQSTRARMPQKFGSGSVGSEMQPKPRFSAPCANKHAQAHTVVATARARSGVPGRGSARASREEPGASEGLLPTPRSPRGRRPASAAQRRDVSARRHRPGLTAQRPAWACVCGARVGRERSPERPAPPHTSGSQEGKGKKSAVSASVAETE